MTKSVAATSYSISATGTGGTYNSWEPTGAAVSGDWQLSAGEYAPTRMTLEWANPTASEGTGSRYLWACSEFNYSTDFAPMGGSAPYHFEISGETSGVTMTKVAPSWNPYCYLWANISIDKNVFTSGTRTFTVTCYDQAGASISRQLTVTFDDTKFIYLDAVAGTGTGVGSFADPFKDIDEWYTSDVDDATYANKICVYKTGTYSADNHDTNVTAMRLSNSKPTAHIAFPGHSPEWTATANIVSDTTTTTDWYIEGITVNGSDSTNANPRVFALFGIASRIMFKNVHFESPVLGTVNTDNTSCIFSSYAGNQTKTNISIVDCSWNNLPSSANGFSLFDFYGVSSTCVLGGTATNISAQYGAWVKNINYRAYVAGLNMYDITNTGHRLLFAKNGSAEAGAIVQIVYCKVAKSTDGLNAEGVLMYGDNNNWGDVFLDRNTAVGRCSPQTLTHDANGVAVIDSNMVFNDQSPIINSGETVTNNTTDTRANISTYLESNGNVKIGHADYGTVGATVKEAV